jgi:hypothetical protein
MDLNRLQAKLINVARQNPPSDAVPYAFEKRVMARLTRPVADAWSLWGPALWRAALPCVFIMLALGATSHFTNSDSSEDLSSALEDTVYAALDSAVLDLDEE